MTFVLAEKPRAWRRHLSTFVTVEAHWLDFEMRKAMTVSRLAPHLQHAVVRGRGVYAGREQHVFGLSFADLAEQADHDTADLIRSTLASLALL